MTVIPSFTIFLLTASDSALLVQLLESRLGTSSVALAAIPVTVAASDDGASDGDADAPERGGVHDGQTQSAGVTPSPSVTSSSRSGNAASKSTRSHSTAASGHARSAAPSTITGTHFESERSSESATRTSRTASTPVADNEDAEAAAAALQASRGGLEESASWDGGNSDAGVNDDGYMEPDDSQSTRGDEYDYDNVDDGSGLLQLAGSRPRRQDSHCSAGAVTHPSTAALRDAGRPSAGISSRHSESTGDSRRTFKRNQNNIHVSERERESGGGSGAGSDSASSTAATAALVNTARGIGKGRRGRRQQTTRGPQLLEAASASEAAASAQSHTNRCYQQPSVLPSAVYFSGLTAATSDGRNADGPASRSACASASGTPHDPDRKEAALALCWLGAAQGEYTLPAAANGVHHDLGSRFQDGLMNDGNCEPGETSDLDDDGLRAAANAKDSSGKSSRHAAERGPGRPSISSGPANGVARSLEHAGSWRTHRASRKRRLSPPSTEEDGAGSGSGSGTGGGTSSDSSRRSGAGASSSSRESSNRNAGRSRSDGDSSDSRGADDRSSAAGTAGSRVAKRARPDVAEGLATQTQLSSPTSSIAHAALPHLVLPSGMPFAYTCVPVGGDGTDDGPRGAAMAGMTAGGMVMQMMQPVWMVPRGDAQTGCVPASAASGTRDAPAVPAIRMSSATAAALGPPAAPGAPPMFLVAAGAATGSIPAVGGLSTPASAGAPLPYQPPFAFAMPPGSGGFFVTVPTMPAAPHLQPPSLSVQVGQRSLSTGSSGTSSRS